MAKRSAVPKAKAPVKKDPKAARKVQLRNLIAKDEALIERAKARLEKRQAELAELEGESGESKPNIVLGEPTPPENKGCLLALLQWLWEKPQK